MSERREKLQNEIKALYAGSLKKPHNVSREYPNLYLRARKVFGSWKSAIQACGIDYEKTRNHKKWSREKIINEIKQKYLKNQSLRLKDLRKQGVISLISSAFYHFGSWGKAVESSGIRYQFGRRRNIKKESQNPCEKKQVSSF
ncbi:MAG TPA: hypothetical protein VH878_02780 [Thermodesulfobacteriota bacterium]|jgi:hypothetical protein